MKVDNNSVLYSSSNETRNKFRTRPSFDKEEFNGRQVFHFLISSYFWEEAFDLITSDVDDEDPPLASIRDEISGDLPLHMALKRGAPEKLILEIFYSYEEAASQPGLFNASFPLHLATIHNSTPTVILTILQKFPEALDLKDSDGDTPRDCMRKGIDNDVRNALMKPANYWKSSPMECHTHNNTASLNNEFHKEQILPFLLKKDSPLEETMSKKVNIRTFNGNTDKRRSLMSSLKYLSDKIIKLEKTEDNEYPSIIFI